MKPPECFTAASNPENSATPVGQKSRRSRAFELDALRGLALVMMILHHFAYDLRYLLELDVFAFLETWWFANLLQPLFLNVFIIVSGICCTFSRSNTRRGLRLLAVALAFTAVTSLVSVLVDLDLYILFNVLHLLALGTLLYSGLTCKERRTEIRQVRTDVILLLLAAILIWMGSLLPHWAGAGSIWLLPFGLVPANFVGMADYLPIVPWLGFFLIGAAIGRQAYSSRQTAFDRVPGWLDKISRPFGFLGQHSLLVYALHQPVLLAVLFGLRSIGLIG